VLSQIVMGADALSADWFSSVLGASVTDVELEPVGGGLIARMVRARLSYDIDTDTDTDADTDAPSSVVVKFPTDDQGSLGLALAMGMYELEVHFYQDVAPLLGEMSIPRCYLAEHDSESGMFTLVLQDLSSSTKPGDVLTPCTLDECASALRELAKFQAPLWNNADLQELDWLTDARRTLGVFDSLPAGLDPFIARFGAALEPEHVELFKAVLPKSGDWVRSWTAPTVVQHGDFRSDNLLFGTAPGTAPVTVIDFQTIRLGPPGLDPAYFLGSSLSTEDRRAHEHDLIAGYHAQLNRTGYGFDDCWNAYRAGAMYGVFLFVGMASQVESTERGDRVIVNQIKRYADMAIDLDAPAAAGLV
jgi:aminoglycoside/choline kinase family phosphotransferase